MPSEPATHRERAKNLWESLARKLPALAHAARLVPAPELDFDQIGGLAEAKDEIQIYACAATNPETYTRWGTHPPSGLLLIGRPGCGKNLLAQALATRTGTLFITVSVPRLVLDMLQSEVKPRDLLEGWSQTLTDLPRVTVFFDELEFAQVQDIGTQRTDLPIGPIMDFLLELLDRTIAHDTLVVGSSSAPQSVRPAFLVPRRFERVVEVNPIFPDDVVAALLIHAAAGEKRAGRRLFEDLDWTHVVSRYRQPTIGDWVRILHAALRRKARREVAGEEVLLVGTEDLLDEVERVRRADIRLQPPGGTYL